MESGVVDKHRPGFEKNMPRSRYQPPPVARDQEQRDINHPIDDQKKHADKMSVRGQSQRVPAPREGAAAARRPTTAKAPLTMRSVPRSCPPSELASAAISKTCDSS